MNAESGDRAIPRDVVGRRVPTGEVSRHDFTYSVIDTAVSRSASDRRGDPRARTRLRDGLVGERRGRVLADCRIRNLSRHGARLQLDKDRPLPKTFLLTDTATKLHFWATLVWQAGRDAGVRLIAVDQG